MSNQAVGSVYQAIIDEVVNSSRVDFEESGVDEAVLEELRLGWQQKLSQLDVAAFPWDPKPDLPPTKAPAVPAAPSPISQPANPFPMALPTGAPSNGSAQHGVKPEAYVKSEPGATVKQEPGAQPASSMPPYQAYNVDNNNSVAASRAQQQLQAQYGNRAAGSISAIQDRMSQQQQQQQHQQGQQPQGAQQQPQAQQQQFRPQIPLPQQPPAGSNAPSNIRNGQTDGPGDDDDVEGVLMRRSAAGTLHELGRVDIDRMLHAQILAKGKSMEGGGLMVPIKEAVKTKSAPSSRSKAYGKGVAAYDGEDDEDIDDEDAINSDLDDPDEDRDEDEVDDEGLGNIMLCMYDKVQRVKNKWKCTLKDGVLTVNGKEYVFHKATGEYEW
ncbi:hypothetical protein S40293_03857 [Stachybotrys chartarum IBT 40293]|nr:hypothetical protein S40293_03857 [Stachybotrys chartarum IBT 40293]